MAELKWAKVREEAIIPTKRDEDAGFDIYACMEEDTIVIPIGEIRFIPTGIASAFPSGYVMLLEERGSTGSKGLARRCGVIDSGFRDEWKVAINNTSNKDIIITKLSKEEIINKYKINDNNAFFSMHLCINNDDLYLMTFEGQVTLYPYDKAIAQALFLPLAETTPEEISYDELKSIQSERGTGMLGSSGK